MLGGCMEPLCEWFCWEASLGFSVVWIFNQPPAPSWWRRWPRDRLTRAYLEPGVQLLACVTVFGRPGFVYRSHFRDCFGTPPDVWRSHCALRMIPVQSMLP
mmetsp:Transcript_37005/g.96925  ORF Transcript_37005/g.96925 Transcript_37005/m.96925 type:complete len:101 (+) Transcript_37005:2193-2495(+)